MRVQQTKQEEFDELFCCFQRIVERSLILASNFQSNQVGFPPSLLIDCKWTKRAVSLPFTWSSIPLMLCRRNRWWYLGPRTSGCCMAPRSTTATGHSTTLPHDTWIIYFRVYECKTGLWRSSWYLVRTRTLLRFNIISLTFHSSCSKPVSADKWRTLQDLNEISNELNFPAIIEYLLAVLEWLILGALSFVSFFPTVLMRLGFLSRLE